MLVGGSAGRASGTVALDEDVVDEVEATTLDVEVVVLDADTRVLEVEAGLELRDAYPPASTKTTMIATTATSLPATAARDGWRSICCQDGLITGN